MNPNQKSKSESFDVCQIRADFPILRQKVHGKPLVYLDNAATAQKPSLVIDAITRYYAEENANIHRGVHWLSERATIAYEAAREKIRNFINATSVQEVIFTRGTTESINLVASSWGAKNLREGDEVLISAMEHHSNIVPWQMICQQTGARLAIIPINDRGEIQLDDYEQMLSPAVKLVSIVHISNALGTVNPVKQMTDLAHKHGALVLVDGAQSVPHIKVDVQWLDCDFFAFSGHKLFGPTGIGVLYGRKEILNGMAPYQGGGDMIRSVSFEKTLYNDLPYKFEAGTPHIAGGIGLGAAIDYLSAMDLKAAHLYEQDLLTYAIGSLKDIQGLTIVGDAADHAGAISFVLNGVHPHDIGTVLDQDGIAIRTGHHCCQPVMERFGISATARASLAFYNTREEINVLTAGIHNVMEIFS